MFLGHETLVDQGIIHRDMSPGNLYLGQAGCPKGWEGFVGDLELASVAEIKTVNQIKHPSKNPKRNERITFQDTTVLSSSKAPGAEITVRLRFFVLWVPPIIIFRALLCSWPESF